MILGGRYQDYFLPVELYNADTGEHCNLGNIPIGVNAPQAINFDGTPFYCGGENPTALTLDCFTFSKDNDTWIKAIIYYRLVNVIFKV